MSVLLVCPCGKSWTSEGGVAISNARCPDCGRPLAPIVAGGWRSLWPRLALTAAATLLAVVGLGIALAHWLPSSHRENLSVALDKTSDADSESEIRKPLQAESEKPLPRPIDPKAAQAKHILPLLDNPHLILPDLDAPKPNKPRVITPLEARPPRAAIELPVKDDFFQYLIVSRVSRYRVLEMDMGQDVQYVFVSRFHVKKTNEDGDRMVEQKIEGVRLSNADPALQERLNDRLQKTKGATFTMTVKPNHEVTNFEGEQEAIKVFRDDNPLGGSSFLLWSFLDRDGWKELAQLTFFRPPSSVRRGERWDRSMTHSWGPLGSWDGKIHFQSAGKQAEFDRFDYQLELAYKPPSKGGGLPFEISKSQFQIQTAHGVIAYQPTRHRIAAAEERFHVRGLLTISFLGAESVLQMDELQLFQLRILDKNPLVP